MKALLIAEKETLKNKIKEVYTAHKNEFPFQIDFLAQAGHLVTLMKPDEIYPEKYKVWNMNNLPIDVPYKYKVIRPDLYNKIRDAINSNQYAFVIHAGDPDPEGELLVNLVLKNIGNTLPVKRFWTNDTTPQAILMALKNLKDDSDYVNICNSAAIRQRSDYFFGMNLTTASSLKLGGGVYKVGRVKAGILRAVGDRDFAIRDFVEKSTWKRTFIYKDCEFINETVYEEEQVAKDNLPNFDYGTVLQVKEETKSYKAPKLYKLSTLQTDAYKRYGFSATQTLELLQHLYEAGLATYPRTDCEYISSGENFTNIIQTICNQLNYKPDSFLAEIETVKKTPAYVNDKAIAKEGHTAVIPTGQGNIKSVGEREQKLYELIARRFLAIFSIPKKVKNLTVIAIPGNDVSLGEYVYKETSDIDAGYEFILNPKYEIKQGRGISFMKEQTLSPVEFLIKECISRPPAKFNEGSLIKFLDEIEFKDENGNKIIYSIGTSATRANIIKECVDCGYLVVNKGIFSITDKAERLLTELGDVSIFNIETSGRWEQMLEQIRQGEISDMDVETYLKKECLAIVEDIKTRDIKKDSSWNSNTITLGRCPHCEKDIVTGKYGAYCAGKCGFKISKAMNKPLTNNQIKSLLAGKRTLITNLTSKAGKKYNAYLTPIGTEKVTYEGKEYISLKYDISF